MRFDSQVMLTLWRASECLTVQVFVAVIVALLLYSDSLRDQLNVRGEYEQGQSSERKCHSGIGAIRFMVSCTIRGSGHLYLIISAFITLQVAVQSNN